MQIAAIAIVALLGFETSGHFAAALPEDSEPGGAREVAGAAE